MLHFRHHLLRGEIQHAEIAGRREDVGGCKQADVQRAVVKQRCVRILFQGFGKDKLRHLRAFLKQHIAVFGAEERKGKQKRNHDPRDPAEVSSLPEYGTVRFFRAVCFRGFFANALRRLLCSAAELQQPGHPKRNKDTEDLRVVLEVDPSCINQAECEAEAEKHMDGQRSISFPPQRDKREEDQQDCRIVKGQHGGHSGSQAPDRVPNRRRFSVNKQIVVEVRLPERRERLMAAKVCQHRKACRGNAQKDQAEELQQPQPPPLPEHPVRRNQNESEIKAQHAVLDPEDRPGTQPDQECLPLC